MRLNLRPVLMLLACLSGQLLFGQHLVTSKSYAQDELLTQSPERFRSYGSVVDEDGVGISKAEVMLVYPGSERTQAQSVVAFKPGTRSTKTNDVGEFEITIQPNDPILFKTKSWYDHPLMLVRAPGFCSEATIPMPDRWLIDLPVRVELSKCDDLNLTVLDVTGKPVANAMVKPARLASSGEATVPILTPWYDDTKTDEQGRVKLAGFNVKNLKSVFVETPTQENQHVQLVLENDQVVAKLSKTGRVTGKLIPSDGSDPKQLAGTKLLLLSHADEKTLLSWQSVNLDEKGAFASDLLTLGSITLCVEEENFPFVVRYEERYILRDEDESGTAQVNIPFKIYPMQTEKIVLLDESEIPVPGMVIISASITRDAISTVSEAVVTSEDGIFLHRFPKDESLDGQLFCIDPLGLYQIPGWSGASLRRLTAKEGQPKSVRLVRSRSLKGIVVDEKDNRIAGAKITYYLDNHGYRAETFTLSDSSGKFEIRELAPSTSVEIQASFESLATPTGDVLTVTSGSMTELKLVLVPQVLARPVGRVVDQSGSPVAGAKVVLKAGDVVQEEGHVSEQLRESDLVSEPLEVVTDDQGRFQYPAISNFAQRIQVHVEKEGYLPLITPYLDGKGRAVKDQKIDLGNVTLLKEPARVKTSVAVVDQATGQPLPNTELVFVGVSFGRKKGVADANGKLELELCNSPQLVAARSPNHQVMFQFLEQVDGSLTLKLDPKPNQADRKPHPWFKQDPAVYRAASRRLIDQLSLPSSNETTIFRKDLYFKALAGLDWERFDKLIGAEESAYKQESMVFMAEFDLLLKQGSQRGLALILRESKLPTYQKAIILSLAASSEPNEEIKDEFYGEATLLLGELSGIERFACVGQVAQRLALDDRVDAAKSLIAEAWSTADELKKILAAGTKKEMPAEARTFLPMYSLVNLDEAVKLIRLTAPSDDLKSILSEAVLMGTLATQVPLQELCEDQEIEFSSDNIALFYPFKMVFGEKPRLGKWCAENAKSLPKSSARTLIAFMGARHLPPGRKRDELIDVAAESPVASYALQEIVQFKSLQEGELDDFTFACLQEINESFLESYSIDQFGNCARLLAFHDPELARRFLQTSMDHDWWHGKNVHYRSRFSENECLRSAAWIDPEFACDVAETLAERWESEGPSYKLELLSDMIQTLNEIRQAIE